MSISRLNNLRKLEEALYNVDKDFIIKNFGDEATINTLVYDSVYCRTFELGTFYEFAEYENIDTQNIDFIVDINMVNGENKLHTLYSTRITSYPGAAVICFTNIKRLSEPGLVIFLDICSDLAKSLYFTQALYSKPLGTSEAKVLQDNNWIELFKLVKQGCTFLTKTL